MCYLIKNCQLKYETKSSRHKSQQKFKFKTICILWRDDFVITVYFLVSSYRNHKFLVSHPYSIISSGSWQMAIWLQLSRFAGSARCSHHFQYRSIISDGSKVSFLIFLVVIVSVYLKLTKVLWQNYCSFISVVTRIYSTTKWRRLTRFYCKIFFRILNA